MCETSGAYSLMMSGARLKDTEIFLPSQKILGVRSWGRVADSKMPGQLSPSRKVLAGRSLVHFVQSKALMYFFIFILTNSIMAVKLRKTVR